MTPDAPYLLPQNPRILILRFSSLGDVVKCTGLPRQIKKRFPQARITMVTSAAFLPLIQHNPHLEQAIGFDRSEGAAGLWALAQKLRFGGYDLVVDVHRSLRSRLLTLLLGAPKVAYSKRTLQRLLLVQWGVNTYPRAYGKEEDFLATLAPWGVEDDGLATQIELGGAEEEKERRLKYAEWLKGVAAWRAGGKPVIGLAPVAAWPLKKWPAANVREFMELYTRQTGGGVLLFGGKAEQAGLSGLAAAFAGQAINLAGATSLLDSAWFARQCDLMVANDTGMSHLAEAVGRPVVALFGPTSRELGYYPVRPDSVALDYPLPCRPCSKNGKGGCNHPLYQACLALITPQRVAQTVGEVLAQQRAVPAPQHP